jgi:hypothetical protein
MARTMRFNRNHVIPPGHDPYRRLVAAVTFYAVTDFLWPHPKLSQFDRNTAKSFCQSPEGQAMIENMGINHRRIIAKLGEPS